MGEKQKNDLINRYVIYQFSDLNDMDDNDPKNIKEIILSGNNFYHFNLTGEMDTNPNSIIHHRIALYGPPCENCSKHYRTAGASFCAACGHKKEPNT